MGHWPVHPIDFWVAFYVRAGFVMILYQPFSSPFLAYVFCAVPLSALILVLGGDWAMQKFRIPRTPIKLLYNSAFLLALNVFVHMALWHTWNPWLIFTTPIIAL